MNIETIENNIEKAKKTILDFIDSSEFGGYYMIKPETFNNEPEIARKVFLEIKNQISFENVKAYLNVDFSKKGGDELIGEIYNDKKDNQQLFSTIKKQYSDKMLIIVFKNNINYQDLIKLKGKRSYYDENGKLVEGSGIRKYKKPGVNYSDRVNNVLHCPDSIEESRNELKNIIKKYFVTKIKFINKK